MSKKMTDLFGNKINCGAEFSNDGKHRYSLWRIWDTTKPLVMFIGLNPSKADSQEDDPTIKSVTRISKHNGYGGFYMMNCWTYISTDPNGLMHSEFADGWNDGHMTLIASKCKHIVFAWGNFKVIKDKGRDKQLIEMFPRALCIRQNKNGSPVHPLFQKSTSILIPYNSSLQGDKK